MKNKQDILSFRKSHIILILRLFVLELVLVTLYLIVRIPKLIVLPSLNDSPTSQVFNYFGLLYFLLLSVIELLLVLQITLDWSNEQYEIRQESLVHRRGIFNLKEQNYTLRNLGSANIYQNFIGKLLNYGTVIISSPILKNDIVLADIHNPQKIVSFLEHNIDESNVKTANIIHRKS